MNGGELDGEQRPTVSPQWRSHVTGLAEQTHYGYCVTGGSRRAGSWDHIRDSLTLYEGLFKIDFDATFADSYREGFHRDHAWHPRGLSSADVERPTVAPREALHIPYRYLRFVSN